jgi:hypothetical protein
MIGKRLKEAHADDDVGMRCAICHSMIVPDDCVNCDDCNSRRYDALLDHYIKDIWRMPGRTEVRIEVAVSECLSEYVYVDLRRDTVYFLKAQLEQRASLSIHKQKLMLDSDEDSDTVVLSNNEARLGKAGVKKGSKLTLKPMKKPEYT